MMDYEKLSSAIDSIAESLEEKGLLEEAAKLDEVANTIDLESAALTAKRRKGLSSGSFVFPAGHAKVKDDDDHFPIDTENRARNALARANQYGEAPSWYDGSLDSLKETIAKRVKAKYPSIEVTEKAIDE
jgi:hypothetical protein